MTILDQAKDTISTGKDAVEEAKLYYAIGQWVDRAIREQLSVSEVIADVWQQVGAPISSELLRLEKEIENEHRNKSSEVTSQVIKGGVLAKLHSEKAVLEVKLKKGKLEVGKRLYLMRGEFLDIPNDIASLLAAIEKLRKAQEERDIEAKDRSLKENEALKAEVDSIREKTGEVAVAVRKQMVSIAENQYKKVEGIARLRPVGQVNQKAALAVSIVIVVAIAAFLRVFSGGPEVPSHPPIVDSKQEEKSIASPVVVAAQPQPYDQAKRIKAKIDGGIAVYLKNADDLSLVTEQFRPTVAFIEEYVEPINNSMVADTIFEMAPAKVQRTKSSVFAIYKLFKPYTSGAGKAIQANDQFSQSLVRFSKLSVTELDEKLLDRFIADVKSHQRRMADGEALVADFRASSASFKDGISEFVEWLKSNNYVSMADNMAKLQFEVVKLDEIVSRFHGQTAENSSAVDDILWRLRQLKEELSNVRTPT